MAKKSKKEEVVKELSHVDKKIAKYKAIIKKLENSKQIMADKKKLKIIAGELRKASAMHKAQAKKIDSMSKGPSMINIAGAVAGLNNQKKSTAVGSVSPHSHDNSKDASKPIQPVGNITGNINQNAKVEKLGKQFFQGDQFANQYASRPPVDPAMPVPPQPNPINDQYGNMFNQPFAQKKIVKSPVPPRPHIEPEGVPQVAIEPTKKIYKKLGKQLMKEVPQKPNRHNELKRKEQFRGVNMMGGVKKPKDPNKGRPYVVNKEKTGTSRDTLYLPKDTYVSKDGYAEDSDIDNAARKAAAEGIYNYTGDKGRNFNFEYLEGSGKVKYKK